MNLQALQNKFAVAGQVLQDIGKAISARMGQMAVTAGRALKQLVHIIAAPFTGAGKAMSERHVQRQEANTPRTSNHELLEHLLADYSEIDVGEDIDLDLQGIPERPRDTLIFDEGEGKHEMHIEDFRNAPQRGILLDDISTPSQHGMLFAHEEDISQTPQHGTMQGHIEDISRTPQRGVLIDTGTVPQHGIISSSPLKPQTATIIRPLSENISLLTKIGMKTGEEAVKESGLVPDHVNKFKSVAKETNTILMFRAVNPMSTGLLQEGTAAKGLNVHGKSSDWGPMAGYIARDQNLCKKHSEKEAIEKGISDNKHSLEHDGERVGCSQLTLSENRLSYLVENKLMQPCDENGKAITESPKEGPRYFLNGGGVDSKGGNQNYMFKIEQGSSGFEVSYKSLGDAKPIVGEKVSDWQPLEVMGSKSSRESAPIPLTADYDMFAMLPKVGDGKLIGKEIGGSSTTGPSPKLEQMRSELEGLRERRGITTDPEEKKSLMKDIFRQKLAIDRQHKLETKENFVSVVNEARTKLLGQEDRRELDPELGRLTGWQREMRTKLNDSVKGEGGYTGGDLIKHGTEQDNTQFSEKDEKVFVIMPNGDTFMTQSWEQTQAFMWSAKQDDFLTYTNRSYVSQNEFVKDGGTVRPLNPGERPTQEQFYVGQREQGKEANKFSGKRLDFDMRQAAENLGLLS